MSELVQSFAVPSGCATKSLKMKSYPGGAKKIVISTNWLVLFGFKPGERVVEVSLGNSKGLVVRKADNNACGRVKSKKVYKRTYKARKNNPVESLIEISAQSLIKKSFGSNCDRVHVVFEHGQVTVTPFITHKAQVLAGLAKKHMYKLFAACTSGVDVSFMAKCGLTCDSILDWRSPEKRDAKRKSDLTETGALTVLRNKSEIRNVFNEDIMSVSTDMLASAFKNNPFSVFMASPQCDDFSNVKSNSLKGKSIDDLSSTLDMTYDMLRIVDALKPPIAVFEQVQGWYKSEVFKLLDLRMRRWGYESNVLLANASDFGGHTLRPRGYAVFTCLPAPFEFEEPVEPHGSLWSLIEPHLAQCRDITDNKSIQKGKANGRLRVFNKESVTCPTLLKSQSRMAADSVVIEHNGRYYWPTEAVLKLIMGIGDDFKLDCVSKDIASEIIGQSVDGSFQSMIARSVKRHIDNFVGQFLEASEPMQLKLF